MQSPDNRPPKKCPHAPLAHRKYLPLNESRTPRGPIARSVVLWDVPHTDVGRQPTDVTGIHGRVPPAAMKIGGVQGGTHESHQHKRLGNSGDQPIDRK